MCTFRILHASLNMIWVYGVRTILLENVLSEPAVQIEDSEAAVVAHQNVSATTHRKVIIKALCWKLVSPLKQSVDHQAILTGGKCNYSLGYIPPARPVVMILRHSVVVMMKYSKSLC